MTRHRGRAALVVAVALGSVALVGLVSAAAFSESGSHVSRDRAVAKRDVKLISRIMGDVGRESGEYDVAGMASECRRLDRVLDVAWANLVHPHAQANRHYVNALSHLELSADACISGATNREPGQLGASARHTRAATRELRLAGLAR